MSGERRTSQRRQQSGDRILDAGRALIHRYGYSATGVAEITAAAEVPKGSFYNHFDSKEALALAAIDSYWAANAPALAALDADGPIIPRIKQHFRAIETALIEDGFISGCLLGNLANEVAPLSDSLRAHISYLFARWTDALALRLEEAQNAGEIAAVPPAQALACTLIAAWEGSIQRTKVDRDGHALIAFHQCIDHWLKGPPKP